MSDQTAHADTIAPPVAWPASQIERWDAARLRPYPRNARTHSEKQIEQLRASLRQFGWTSPILAREDGTVIAGHGRLEAGKAEGYKVFPVIVATGWTDEQCRAYALVDNQLGLNSAWDAKVLGAELKSLSEIGIKLSEFGFGSEMKPPGDTRPQLTGLTYSVIVRCMDEAHQTELLATLETQGLTCEALIS